MHSLPAGRGSTLPRRCARAPVRTWAPRSSWPAHHLECRHQLAQQRHLVGAKQRQRQPAWWCTGRCRTGWCRLVCSSSAERHASNRAASGVRSLLLRLRSSLPSADAIALQAGAVRHPKFAPMVLLCAPAMRMTLSRGRCRTALMLTTLRPTPGPQAGRFFSMSFVNTILDSLGNSLVVTAVGGGPEVIPFLTGEVAYLADCPEGQCPQAASA